MPVDVLLVLVQVDALLVCSFAVGHKQQRGRRSTYFAPYLPPPAHHIFHPFSPSLLLSHFHGRLATLDAWTLDVPPHSLTPPDTLFNKVGKS